MCWPKAKPDPLPPEDPDVVAQREAAKERSIEEARLEKENRTRAARMRLAGVGVRTLLGGGKGGAGYSRNLLG